MRPSSLLAAALVGVATLASGTALAATLGISLSSGSSGTSPSNPLVMSPERHGGLGSGQVYSVSAELTAPDAGTYQNATVTIELPAGIRLESGALSGFTFQGCTADSGSYFNVTSPSTCTWQRANHVGTGSNATVMSLVVKAAAMRFRDGQEITLGGTFSADGFTPAGGGAAQTVTSGTDTLYGRIDTKAGLVGSFGETVHDILASRYGYGPDGVTQGYIEHLTVQLSSHPGSNIVDDVQFVVALPPGSVYTDLRLVDADPRWAVTQTSTSLTFDWSESDLADWVSGFPGRFGSAEAYFFTSADSVQVEAFVPCDRFDDNTAAPDIALSGTVWAYDAQGGLMTNEAWSLQTGVATATDDVGNGVYSLPVWTNGVPPANAPWCIDAVNPPAGVRRGGGISKDDNSHAENDVDAGVIQFYDLVLQRPVGEPGLTDVAWIDRLPEGLWSLPGGSVGITLPGTFDALWFCDLSAYPDEIAGEWVDFDVSEVDLADCTLGGSVAPAGTTHILMLADSLGAAGPSAWSGLSNIAVTVRIVFPLGYVSGAPDNEARNQTWMTAGYTRAGAAAVMSDLALSLEGDADGVADRVYTTSQEWNDGNENNTWDVRVHAPEVAGDAKGIAIRQPSNHTLAANEPIVVALPSDPHPEVQRFDIAFTFEGIDPVPPTAPVFEVTLPPGFIFYVPPGASDLRTGAGTTVWTSPLSQVGTNCGGAAPTVTFTSTGTTYTWRTGPDFVLEDSLVSNRYCAGIPLQLYADPQHGFVNGQEAIFSARLLHETPTGDVELDAIATVPPKKLAVSPAVDFTATLACIGDGRVGVDVTASNAGGQPFTALESRIDFQTTLTAAQKSAILASLMATGPHVASATFAGNTLVVTLTRAAPTVLEPFADATYHFEVPIAAALSLVSTGSAVALDTASTPPTETTVQSTSNEIRNLDPLACAGGLLVQKRLGVGTGSVPYPGVGFTATSSDATTTIGPQATDAAGETLFADLAAGTWTLTETLPSEPFKVWQAVTIAPVTVVANSTTIVEVVNRCTCEARPCMRNTGGCEEPGDACTYVPDVGASCELDADKCTVDQCNDAGACANVSTVSCNDGDMCTGDQCDPATGQCATTELSPPPQCEDGAFFALGVTAPDGTARFVVCTFTVVGGASSLSCGQPIDGAALDGLVYAGFNDECTTP